MMGRGESGDGVNRRDNGGGAVPTAIRDDDHPRTPSTTDDAGSPGTTGEPDLGNPEVVAAIRAEIDRAGGRIPFERFMQMALYLPGAGYYVGERRRPGRGGDFLTAPELHPMFGFALARQVADCWERLGHPDTFTVREYGAGVGGLAYDILASLHVERPEVAAAVRYRLVEANPFRREQAMAAMREVGLAGQVEAIDPAEEAAAPPITGLALANEVADAFPVRRLVVRGDGPREAFVAWSDAARGFVEVEGAPADAGYAASLQAALAADGVTLAEGDRLDVSPAAADWFGAACRGVGRGYALVIDYGYPAPTLFSGHRLGGTLRAYSGHTVSDDPFRLVGEQDLTAHVDFTALEQAGRAAGAETVGLTTQGAFLASLGLGDWLLRLQADPATDPATYYQAQSAVFRLIDPGGMGRFGVLMMARDAPVSPPPMGFTESPPTF